MLLNAYTAIEAKLAEISEIKHLDWFNDQYSGIIHTAPAVFIEFPVPLKFKTLRGQFQVAPLVIRVHIASKMLPDMAGMLSKTLIAEHELIVNKVYKALQGAWAQYDVSHKLFDSLGRTALERIQYMKGWFVTTQDFESRIYQHEDDSITVIADDLGLTIKRD